MLSPQWSWSAIIIRISMSRLHQSRAKGWRSNAIIRELKSQLQALRLQPQQQGQRGIQVREAEREGSWDGNDVFKEHVATAIYRKSKRKKDATRKKYFFAVWTLEQVRYQGTDKVRHVATTQGEERNQSAYASVGTGSKVKRLQNNIVQRRIQMDVTMNYIMALYWRAGPQRPRLRSPSNGGQPGPACWAGPTRASGGHQRRVALTAVPGLCGRAAARRQQE